MYRFVFAASLLLIALKASPQSVITIDADFKNPQQTIQNFGASGCWFSEPVGRFWADSVKNKMAALLFSTEIEKDGTPKGIGLSAWRFNIGAGTAEQGDSSGIKDVNRRVPGFLDADGTYDWTREQGYLWFVKKAQQYGVKNLIAFVNSPPVFYTKNGLGYKTNQDGTTNLRPDKYGAYADFLATVLQHFENDGIRFNYVSPVNEPQWKWFDKFGEASQEGSPYTNQEIFNVVKTLDSSLQVRNIHSSILMPEAGMLNYLYSNPANSKNGNEIKNFFDSGGRLYVGGLKHVAPYIAGHGYFTEDAVANTIAIRQKTADTAKKYGTTYWQTEYSMLGNGYKEGQQGPRSGFDCAMFLAKLIYYDLTYGNATAWQFWNAWEPGKADFDTRYYLLALQPAADFKSGTFKTTKNLWALGHYSRFIRPGMVRIPLNYEPGTDILASAYHGQKKLVIVIINNDVSQKQIRLNIPANYKKAVTTYITTAANTDNMHRVNNIAFNDGIKLAPRSINTLVINEK